MMDSEMVEAEASSSQPQPQASSSGQNGVVRDLLTLARQLITQGKPSQALQAVIFSSSFIILSLHFQFLICKIFSLIFLFIRGLLICVLCCKCSSFLNKVAESAKLTLGLERKFVVKLLW